MSGGGRSANGWGLVLCAVVVVVLAMVVDFVQWHPYWSAFLASRVVAGVVAVGLAVSERRAASGPTKPSGTG